jgi:acetylxylan esterase
MFCHWAPVTVLALLALTVRQAYAAAGQLQQVNGVTPNPNNVGMFVYKPARLASPTPLIVAIHYCGGYVRSSF